METIKRMGLVGTGGALGAIVRYSVSLIFAGAMPWPTLGINVVGSFLLGVLVGLDPAPGWRLFLGTGILGGFTTFSAFSVEAMAWIEAGEWRRAALYVFGSLFFGLFAAAAGIALARGLASR